MDFQKVKPMDEVRELIVKEAREWVGTPWHHNQCCKGIGVDCARLYQGILSNVLGIKIEIENYPRHSTGDNLLKQVRSFPFLLELTDASKYQEGDLLVFFIGAYPRHIGVATKEGMIHADLTKGMVTEIPVLGHWQSRLCAAFRVIMD